MNGILSGWLEAGGVPPQTATWLAALLLLLLLLLAAWLLSWITQRVLIRLVRQAAERSITRWDDIFIRQRVFQRLAYFIPLAMIGGAAPLLFNGSATQTWLTPLNQLLWLAAIILLVLVGLGLVNALADLLTENKATRELPLASLVQLSKIGLLLAGTMLGVATLLGENPLVLLSGLGALAAVLSFVYQDALRGLVAGIQLTSSKMLARGDVIEVPAHGAVGVVEEIGLWTIKIRNGDFTITTVPTYALISGSFKNWRGLESGDGRRMMRAIWIDVQTIRYCDAELRSRLQTIGLLRSFWDNFPASESQNGDPTRHQAPTNLTVFRAYLEAYLNQLPAVNPETTLLVRQLDPTPQGLPLQIYAFSRTKEWLPYEALLSDIFEHTMAIVPVFGLALYQSATS